jgi:hypothetical protein
MKKCFIILQFGSPHKWTQQYIDHVQHLEKYGWYWKIFTPNDFQSKGNVEIVKMDINGFNKTVEEKLGVNPKLFITPLDVPSYHVTDFLITLGAVFEDYLKEFDFWGVIGLDCVVGRLDHFLPDSKLDQFDVWSDDLHAINGNFCLWRNKKEITDLFKRLPQWETMLVQTPCPGCMGIGADHFLYATDEHWFSDLMLDIEKEGVVRYGYPKYFDIHGHDRLEIHRPVPKLRIEDDGSLWQLIEDVAHPDWKNAHKFFGNQIAYFHFSQTKEWPL